MMPLKASSGHAWHPPNPYKSLVIVCKYPSSWLDPPDLYETCVLQDSQETVLAMRPHQPQNLAKNLVPHSLRIFSMLVKRCRTKQGELLSTWFWGCDFSLLQNIDTWNAHNCYLPTTSWLLQEFKKFKFQGTYSMPKTSWAKHKGWQPKVLAFFLSQESRFMQVMSLKKKWQTPRISFMKSFSWISFERFPVHTNTNSRAPTEGFRQISSPTHITRNPNWPQTLAPEWLEPILPRITGNHKQHRTFLHTCAFSFKVNQNRCFLLDHCFCPV